MTVSLEFLNETEEQKNIATCLRTLYGTPVGSVALDRDFGLDWSFLDLPLPAARARLENEIIRKTMKYEPRVSVQELRWEYEGAEGRLAPKVVVKIE